MKNLNAYRSMRKLSLELELGGVDVTGHFGGGAFRCADYVVSEGHTLEDLLENQTVFLSDQDGGEAGELEGLKESDSAIEAWFEKELAENPWLFYTQIEPDYMSQAKEARIGSKD